MLFHAGDMESIVPKKPPLLHNCQGSFECLRGDPVHNHRPDTPYILHHFPDVPCITDKVRVQFHLADCRFRVDAAVTDNGRDKETVEHFIEYDNRSGAGKKPGICIFQEPGAGSSFFSGAKDNM